MRSALYAFVIALLVCANASGQLQEQWRLVLTNSSISGYAPAPEFEVTESGRLQPRSFARVNEGGSVRLHTVPPTNNVGIFGPGGWQWHLGGNAIAGATNTYLVVSNATIADGGLYSLTASNFYASASRSITLVVEPAVRTIYSMRRRTWDQAHTRHELDARAPFLAANSSSQVYLVGTHPDMSGWFLTKYRQNGTVMWNRQFGPVATPAGVAVDAAQNVIVACTTNYWVGGGPMLVKYDANGNLLWTKAVIAGKNPWRFTTDFAQNNAGELFVAGSDAGADPTGIFVAKLSANGALVWARFLRVSPAWWFFARASLAPTPGGGVYVGSDIGLARFDAAGQRLWLRGSNYVSAAVAPDGIVYAAGNGRVDKYAAATGELLLSLPFEGTRIKADSYGVVVLDRSLALRVDAQGQLKWTGFGGDAMALDASGSVYISSLAGSLIARAINAQGQEIWQTASDETRSFFNSGGGDVAVCPNGDVAVAHQNEDHYVVERYRPGASATPSSISAGVSGGSVFTPGTEVCFIASRSAVNERFAWFRNEVEISGETNRTLCMTADWDTEVAVYQVAAVGAKRVVTSAEARFWLQRPFLYRPTKEAGDQIRLRLLPFAGYGLYRIEATSDFQTWNAVTNVTGGGYQPLSVTLPNDGVPARFFRAVGQ